MKISLVFQSVAFLDGYSIWNLNKQWLDKSMVGYLGDIKNDITQPEKGGLI